MKQTLITLFVFILAGCFSSKQTYYHVTKPTNERESKALRWADSAVCKMLGYDSTTYDWNKKIQFDWKNGHATTHKIK